MEVRYKLTLELSKIKKYEYLEAHRGDKNSRIIDCTLTANDVIVPLTTDMTATFDAVTENVIVADGMSATVDTSTNEIIIPLSEEMLSVPGLMKIDLKVSEGDTLITAQTIGVKVGDSAINNNSKFDSAGGTIEQLLKNKIDNVDGAVKLANLAQEILDYIVSNGGGTGGITEAKVTELLKSYVTTTTHTAELAKKEDIVNRVESFTQNFTDESGTKYPTVLALLKHLEDYYYDFSDIDGAFDGIRIDDNGDLIVALPAGSEKNLGSVKGEAGADGKDGADYVLTDEDKSEIVDTVKAEVPLVKSAEQPTIVDSVDDMTDTSKTYVLLSDGYFYQYEENDDENYNLLKVSECTFMSRLQDDAETIVSSTAQNVVSGWFPVTYGRYYTMSTTHDDIGRSGGRFSWVRVQLKLADGTIKLYSLSTYPSTDVSICHVYGVDDQNAVAMRVQIQIKSSSTTQADISTATNLKAYYPMIVEGDTATEAYNNAMTFDYLDGDVGVEVIAGWYNTGLSYNQSADYENRINELESDVSELQNDVAESVTKISTSKLYEAQKYIADDWRVPFIDVFHKLGLGSNHIIPSSYNVWGGTGNDLTQKNIMMSDGVHPSMGDGVTMMYAQAIIPQLKTVPPLYSAGSENDDWTGKNILWMGTSIPAGSDSTLGVEGIGTTYPVITANKLGANCINIAKGSSCVRINASAGDYSGFKYAHFIRALSRTTAEADMVLANWDSIKANVEEAVSVISDSDLATMKAHSFETLLLPYLDGTNTMPDLFVIDHGHNDIRPLGVDGKQDSLVEPTLENIENGTLAEDTYMTANDYANLKIAFNNDLSKIPDLASFAASVNRNCFIGAMNFLITLIYRHNPKARIVIISDYD